MLLGSEPSKLCQSAINVLEGMARSQQLSAMQNDTLARALVWLYITLDIDHNGVSNLLHKVYYHITFVLCIIVHFVKIECVHVFCKLCDQTFDLSYIFIMQRKLMNNK